MQIPTSKLHDVQLLCWEKRRSCEVVGVTASLAEKTTVLLDDAKAGTALVGIWWSDRTASPFDSHDHLVNCI